MAVRDRVRAVAAARGRLLVLAALGLSLTLPSPVAATGDAPEIRVLSNRADLISGGDALVEVALAPGVDPGKVRVDVDGRDVTSRFALRPNGRFMGLVTGLRDGENVLTARGRGGVDRITITNHPIGGPVFSGPQLRPWICETNAEPNTLGPALDEQCNAATAVDFLYQSTDPSKPGFQPYDPKDPPSDVATTRTDQGAVVPYIVRRETGTMNRGVYQFAVLHDPVKSPAPWASRAGWNGKLHYILGADAKPQRRQGAPKSVLGEPYPVSVINSNQAAELALSRGWAVATHSLNIHGLNTNFVTSAESLMMVKEHLIEQLGEIRYTMGFGCSGGAVQQHLIADAYPGLLDGLVPSCSFPDLYMTAHEVVDCGLLLRYYNTTSPQLWTVEAQRAAVDGTADVGPCQSWITVFGFDGHWFDPRTSCVWRSAFVQPAGVVLEQPEWVYDPQTNPHGARCTLQDHQVAIFGRRPPQAWGEVEQRIGSGFANRPYDNVGVQYGLRALESGLITPEQFADLNEKIGGYDIDKNWQSQRSAADLAAVEIAYRAGAVTFGRQLAKTPIVDLRAADNNEVHTDFHSYAMRARLEQANGHHDNQVIWTSAGVAFAPDEQSMNQAFLLMDAWLAGIEADPSSEPLEVKVRRHRPAQAVDACWIAGRKVTDPGTCRAAFPYFGNPRTAAGGPLANNILKCQLTPLSRADYGVSFTDEQWARVLRAFPSGVCDHSQPSVGQHPPTPWLSFADGPGGRPVGPAPGTGQ
ncbi:MAG: DUF6351 family protein [Actinophytocola sp.]|uniref:DUF6351 family protein n=1 Tax=Actinophytocola sp. TaxID=1872138 RepID=UPI003D6B1583